MSTARRPVKTAASKNRFPHAFVPATTEATVLTDAFDPAELPPGIYVVSSVSEAFWYARIGAEAGVLRLLGERDEADGTLTLTVAPGPARRRPRRNAEFSGAISLGPAYFQAPLREYSEWPVKWWREVIQNAADAGATQVELGSQENLDGTFTVWCVDNGGGMSREVLFDAFLVMGGSAGKTDVPGKTGGFGKAKELILLPWLAWTVTTGSHIVHAPGGGATWEATTVPTHFRGTRVEVVQPAGNHTSIAAALEFLQRSWLPGIRFTLSEDGKPVEFTRRQMHNAAKNPPLRDLESMTIYFDELRGEKRHNAWIRINGLYMFTEYVSDVPGQIVVELKGSSLETLTSNRDGFANYQIKRQLSGFLNELAKDTTSALKAKKGIFKKKYSTGQKFQAIAPEVPFGANAKVENDAGKKNLSGEGVAQVLEQFAETVRGGGGGGGGRGGGGAGAIGGFDAILDAAPELLANLQFSSDRALEAALQQLVWEPDFILINEVENFRVPPKFQPETMTPMILRLAKVWVETCRWVLMQLGCGKPYAVGFIFDSSTGAAYQNDNGEHWILLNPFAADPKMRDVLRSVERGWNPPKTIDDLELLRVTNRNDFRLLYAMAVHECTHFSDEIDYHDEAFAAALTYNFAKCAEGMSQWRTILNATAAKRGEVRGARSTPAKATPKAAKRTPTIGAHTPHDLNPLRRVTYTFAAELLPRLLTANAHEFTDAERYRNEIVAAAQSQSPTHLADAVRAAYYATHGSTDADTITRYVNDAFALLRDNAYARVYDRLGLFIEDFARAHAGRPGQKAMGPVIQTYIEWARATLESYAPNNDFGWRAEEIVKAWANR